MRLRFSPFFAAVLAVSFALAGAAQTRYEPNWAALDARPTPQWFLDAKFGIFIHWGVYSVPSYAPVRDREKNETAYAEWYWHSLVDGEQAEKKTGQGNHTLAFHRRVYGADFDYSRFAPMFRAELFDPAQWADTFVRSGARYIVPTSKHHEGFALWPSAEASRTWGRPWNAVETGPKRDLLGDLGAAVRQRGLHYGFYYSLYEWFNPLWLSDRRRYVAEHMIPQFKDVVTRYKPDIIFSDGEWDMDSKDWRSEELLAWLFNESPARDQVVINDRWGKDTRHKHGGYYTTEYAAGMKDASHPWEESRGIAYSYGYNRAETVDDYKTGRELILLLIDTVSRGGNLLLDIGPTADGRIPGVMQQRLLEIGDWLKVNGEAIYGTRFAGRPVQWSEGKRPDQQYGEYMVQYGIMQQIGFEPKNGVAVKQAFFTKKPGALYAILPGWPHQELVLRHIRVPATPEVTLLGWPAPLRARVEGQNLVVQMPDAKPGELPVDTAYTLKIPGGELLPE